MKIFKSEKGLLANKDTNDDKKNVLDKQGILYPSQFDKIKKFIQKELLKRGFSCNFIKFEISDPMFKQMSKGCVELQTETFQTVPVIYEWLRIDNCGGLIELDKDGEDKYTFFIPLNVVCKSFNHGCLEELSLFNVIAKVINGFVEHMDITVHCI